MAGLKFDMCHLRHPANPRSTLKPELIDACLPPEVQYACLYWVPHQDSAGIDKEDGLAVLNFLKEHFLHWIEALILLGRFWQVPGLIRVLQSTLAVGHMDDATELCEFLDDATMFLRRNASDINATPLQLYSSVLVFAPTASILGKMFAAQAPPWITLLSGRASGWDPRLRLFHSGKDPLVTAFSSDSKLLTSVTRRGQVRVWSTESGECVEEFDIDLNGLRLNNAIISLDGKAVATWSSETDTGIRVTDTAAGGGSFHYGGPLCFLRESKFSQYSTRILTVTPFGKITAWDRSTGNCLQELCISPPRDHWKHVEISPLSTAILLVDKDNIIHIWCLEREREIFSAHPLHHLSTNADNLKFEPITFSRDDRLLAFISEEHEVQIWSIQEDEYIQSLREDNHIVKGVKFSFDSSFIAVLSEDQCCRIWRISTGECAEVQEFCIVPDETMRFLGPGMRSCYKRALLGIKPTEDCFQIWNLIDGRVVFELTTKNIDFVFSEDSESMASVTKEQCDICVWDRKGEGFELRCVLKVSEARCRPMAFSPDSKWLAATDKSNKIWCWNVDTQQCAGTISPERTHELVIQVAFSPDSAAVAARFDDEIMVWDLATGELIGKVRENKCFTLTLSPIGTFMACWDAKEIRIWNWKTGVCLAKARAVHNLHKTFEFLPDNYGIRTEVGTFTLPRDVLVPLDPGSEPQELHFVPVFSVDAQWIQYRGRKLVKLPPEYNSDFVTVRGDTVTLDSESGEIVLIKIFEEELKRCLEVSIHSE
ncbi:hypothetical protein NW762_014550 [Fusarium torreyae]|uniref:Vegetative incompatibility protein HET-E-1 n=1 Tax=Fusarium torreyae TaxID=1237075 RepID=A0A9W8RJZ9_9HYPO|nr:hypothetical protein NW762_014550 [Fusarium torreyae]